MIRNVIIFIFFYFFSTIAFADSYQKTSPYWSSEKNGPRSMDQAIEMFFQDRPLDPLEGIWTESDWGLVAITKSGNNYHKYVISVDYEGLNGTHETTYLKTADQNFFTFFTRISWEDGNWYKFKTSPGTLVLKNENYAERIIDKYAMYPSGTLIRNWPTDLYSYNKKFDKVIDKDSSSSEEKSYAEKFYALNWNNLDNPKDHYVEIPGSNSEVYILENEIYLKGRNDVDSYTQLAFNNKNSDATLVVFESDNFEYTIYARYYDDGYISTKDWSNINSSQLKSDLMQYKKENVTNVEWVFEPEIDNNVVTYSYLVSWKDEHKTMETKVLVLGRNGYIDISFLKEYDDLLDWESHKSIALELGNSVTFKDGFKYSDYRSGDKKAVTGIGGLVAGTLGVKALAKTGVLAKILPFIVKFWWIILAPIVAFFGFFNKSKSKKNISKSTKSTRAKKSFIEAKPKKNRSKKKEDDLDFNL